MRWRVTINNIKGDDILAEVLAAAGYTLDGDMLSGEPFERLENPPDVARAARELAHNVREIGRLNPELDIGFDVPGSVFDGKREHKITEAIGTPTLKAITSQGNVINTTLSPAQQAEIQRRERATMASELLRAILASDDVLKVMRLLDGEPGTFELWKAYELVRADGGIDTTHDDTYRFRKTCNDPRLTGDAARHALPDGNLPPDPMSLPDAVAFMRKVAANWMKEKAK